MFPWLKRISMATMNKKTTLGIHLELVNHYMKGMTLISGFIGGLMSQNY